MPTSQDCVHNKCDIEFNDDQSNNDNGNYNNQNNTNINKNKNNNSNINNDGTTTDNSNQDNASNNDNSNSDSSNNNSSSDDNQDDNVEEPEDEMFVRDKRLVWDNVSELKIFTNSVYNFEEKIAPESSNTYQFIVKNSTSYNLKYNMSFIETNPYNINMKYKLKKNDTYIVDHYVSYNELNINDQLLNAKTNDTFYLEWKWISSDNDNQAGENSANYELKIKVEAESTNG